MNPQSENAMPEAVDTPIAPPRMAETRPLYWSVRRELWEHRSVILAPLIVAAVVLFGTFISTTGLPKRIRAAQALDPAKLHAVVTTPFNMAPAPIMFATLLVGLFYSLDALYGERRDRSVLFWKSLPVSDRTTVLSKASIPLVVLPLIALALSVITQVLLLMLGTMILMGNGMSPSILWSRFHFFEGLLIMIYGLSVHILWFAPIYGWLLLVSAWAKRTPVLWAVFPVFAIGLIDRLVFGSSRFAALLKYRVIGAMAEAFASSPSHGSDLERLSQLTPARFLSAPGLWLGLAFAAACLAASVRLRRHRQPI